MKFKTSSFLVFLALFASVNLFAQNQDKIHWLTVSEMQEAMKKEPRKVLIDVYTNWCGPCKMIAPVLEDIADDYAGKVKIVKLNIDENEQTPPKYNIRGIPTLMLFKNGNVDATKVGALSKSQLTAFVDSNL